MRIQSAQGIVLAGCAAYRPAPGAAQAEGADGFDQGHHSLVWSNRSGLEVRTPRVSSMVGPRSGFWVPAGLPYTVEASSPWWTASFVARSCPAAWRRVSIVEFDDVIGSLLAHVAVHPDRPWSADFVSAVVTHLFDAFASHAAPLTFPTDPRAREVANGLVADPASVSELSDWAPRVGASERTLRRLFLEQTGLTFRRWRVRLRAHGAMRLLSDGLPVGEVARRSGYTSTTAFARAFESETGVGPSDYVAGVTAALHPDPRVDTGKWPMRSRSWPRRRDASEQSLIDLAERLIGGEVNGEGRPATNDTTTVPSAAAPSPADEAVDQLTVVDGLGRMLTFDETPARIACRNSGASMLLADLGLVPVSTFFEPERAALYFGDDAVDDIAFAPVSAEEQAVLEPDLVVTGELDRVRPDLETLFPVYAIATGSLVENARKLTTDIAALTGRVAEGEQVIKQWEEFVAKLTDLEVEGAEDVRLLQLWGGAPDSYQGWTNISDWSGLLTDLHLVGECLFDPETPDQQFAEFSAEAVVDAQPTHISYVLEWQLAGTDGYVLPDARQDHAWSQLDAVAAGNVYVVPTTGHFANGFFEIMYELENYLFHVFGPEQGFEDPGPFVEWKGPSL
ncbi:MAG: helix-turn-helix domain-containing protein [Actinomycetota bacterium]